MFEVFWLTQVSCYKKANSCLWSLEIFNNGGFLFVLQCFCRAIIFNCSCCSFLFNMSKVLGITSAHSVAFVDPEAAVPGHGLKSEVLPWILPPRSKHSPINRVQGEAGQQQNDRHLYYKPQTLQQRPSVSLPHTCPLNPISQCQSLWVQLA